MTGYKVAILNTVTPKSGFTHHADIAYGNHARHQLDIYISKQQTSQRLPVIVFVHGGSWNKGSKDDYLFLGDALTAAGYITVIINYRLAPAYVYPDYVTDTAKAIAWTYRHIADYGGDVSQLFVMGHSAGAFNAIAAVNTPVFFETEGIPVEAVKAVIGIAGPYTYDFRTDPTDYAFPKEGHPDAIMPNRLVRKHPVPHLLLVAENDNLVEDYNTHEMATALQAQGGSVEVIEIKRANHVNVIAAFSRRLTRLANTKAVVLNYLSQFE